MRHLSCRADHRSQRALRCQRHAIIRWLAVDQKAASARTLIRNLRAGRVPLLAHHEEQPTFDALLAQLLRSRNLRRDDPLRVTRAAAINKFTILTRRQ